MCETGDEELRSRRMTPVHPVSIHAVDKPPQAENTLGLLLPWMVSIYVLSWAAGQFDYHREWKSLRHPSRVLISPQTQRRTTILLCWPHPERPVPNPRKHKSLKHFPMDRHLPSPGVRPRNCQGIQPFTQQFSEDRHRIVMPGFAMISYCDWLATKLSPFFEISSISRPFWRFLCHRRGHVSMETAFWGDVLMTEPNLVQLVRRRYWSLVISLWLQEWPQPWEPSSLHHPLWLLGWLCPWPWSGGYRKVTFTQVLMSPVGNCHDIKIIKVRVGLNYNCRKWVLIWSTK